ncbi:hypothetical protein QAD02_019765 [Eretmocerus hayati]|uniref:Uncharacterized protein n=1 Tax=Eretmocerus hayati TaxID=131215 RepID=A0ACC2PLL6_9HYME|nr:hypothetical protein QAD02_019765 [Eretmocerus hayati]
MGPGRITQVATHHSGIGLIIKFESKSLIYEDEWNPYSPVVDDLALKPTALAKSTTGEVTVNPIIHCIDRVKVDITDSTDTVTEVITIDVSGWVIFDGSWLNNQRRPN